jgi:phage terminase large subunit
LSIKTNIKFEPHEKQDLAFQYLEDNVTQHILFGGSVAGGKTYFGCMWLLINCFRYPGTRWIMARSRLSTLKRTTLATFLDLVKKFNLQRLIKVNHQTNIIYFKNGSEIYLYDLFLYPSDPNYERLGGVEITGAYIDELSEIENKAFQVISSRIRYKLTEYNLIPKILCTSNPCKGWPYSYFYKPWRDREEQQHVKFIQSLTSDNVYNNKYYVDSLQNLDLSLRQRLLLGDWDFDDSDFQLFLYDSIQNCFYNDYFVNNSDKMYITADIANTGSDSTVICIWRGWSCLKIETLNKKDTIQVVQKIRELISYWKVNITNVIIDSAGVGVGVADTLKGCIKYIGSEKPLNGEKYRNIKSQLYFKFAEKVNNMQCNFNFDYNEKLVFELLAVKKDFNIELFSIETKDKIKQQLGRSPDIADALYLRAYFEYQKQQTKIRII